MASASDTSTTDKENAKGDDEHIDSSHACLLLELASILCGAAVDPTQIGLSLGISNDQVEQINSGLEDPKNRILHFLERFCNRHGDDWQAILEGVVRDKLENPDLAMQIQSVKLRHDIQSTSQLLYDKNVTSMVSDTPKSRSRTVSQRSSTGPGSSWDMAAGNHGSHSDRDDAHSSESFERLSEEQVFLLRDGEQPSRDQNQHPSLDNPEMSMLISKVGDALKVVSEVLGNIEGIKQLPEVIPEILQLVRQMKSQKMLRLVFEEENSNLKQDLQRSNEIIRELREKLEQKESELAELKRAGEDKSLKDFEVVTRTEAHEIKEEKKKVQERQTSEAQAPASSQSSDGVSVEAYESLQKKNITLKQKLAQVVKLNHSWDEQYHRMESALRQDLDTVRREAEEKRQDWERREKEREEEVSAAKEALRKFEAEKAEVSINLEQSQQQVAKMKRYALSLQVHKQDLETEVKRLNEALEKKIQVKATKVAAAPAPSHAAKSKSKSGKAQDEGALLSNEERSILASMSPDDLIEELGLLKQQVDVYKSDFFREQKDRQRAAGELDEVKTDLHRAKKKVEKQKAELQILQDQALAYKYHYQASDRNLGQPTGPSRQPTEPSRQTRPAQKPRPSNQAYGGLRGPRTQHYQNKHRRQRDDDELVPHGVNYAMNDEYVDAAEGFDVRYPPASSDLGGDLSGEEERNEPLYQELH